MLFSPASDTQMKAVPVGSLQRPTKAVSTPAPASERRSASPSASSPVRPIMLTPAPIFAAATAWLPPLPPGFFATPCARIVSPGAGICATR